MFQLTEATEVNITNANPRREMHGEEKVRAIDLTYNLTGDNSLLDLIQDGLRKHHFCNRAADAQQDSLLPDEMAHLPNIRYPNLPTVYHFQKGVKLRGYRFIWDYGLDEARVDFQDVVLANLQYEIFEGGSVEVKGTIQYNGEELQDNILYGDLCGLAAEEPIYIKLLAPATAQVAKKGYRAGKPDTQPTPEKNPDQLDLDDVQQSPEDAFVLAAMGKVWSRGCDEDKYDCIDALLEATHAEEELEVGEELDIETESGQLVVIRITDIDAETDKASFEIASQQAMEEAEG